MKAVNQIPDISTWAESAAKELRETADNLASTAAPDYLGEEHLSFASLNEGANAAIERLTLKSKIDRDRCLYIMTLDEHAEPSALKKAFSEAKQRCELKLPQDNAVESLVLYVGSSCATNKRKNTLRGRLKHHLIKASKGTYALSLAEWTQDLCGGINVHAWQYPSLGEGMEGDEAARKIVLAVEDWLANELKPMLGRRGSRH